MSNVFGMGFGMGNMPIPMVMQGGNQFMGLNNNIANTQNQNEEWLKGFQLGVNEVVGTPDANDAPGPKLNAIYTTTKGTKTTMVYPHGTTIDKALEEYLKRMGSHDLYLQKSNKICFLFQGSQMKFGDQRTVEQFFGFNTAPKIIVNDVHSLIGA